MKVVQTDRCVLCHLADPVVPRPRSARCVRACQCNVCLSFSPLSPFFFRTSYYEILPTEKQASFVPDNEKEEKKKGRRTGAPLKFPRLTSGSIRDVYGTRRAADTEPEAGALCFRDFVSIWR